MLFNSYGYLFLFLPIALLGYFALARFSQLALTWLTAASLFFYAWWNPWHLPIIIGSMVFNFWMGQQIISSHSKRRWMWLGIVGNLALLGAFKYTHFAVGVLNDLSGVTLNLPDIALLALPLGVSFFTFTQIAYLVDTARGEVRETHPVHYALFVTFFPHLLAGPILHHKEMMPQFADASARRFDIANFSRGLFLLSLGLGKKLLIADPLGEVANAGFANVAGLDFGGVWMTTLAYTFQLYFDFSGYTDMALGTALMFNIRLPINFDSPYLASNIQDFWRRWHITLSRFLRDYLYIPLGGNKSSDFRVGANIMMTFVLGGLWHGAGWTFIAWGALHGAALVVFRLWQHVGIRLPRIIAWACTLVFVHVAWVFFRAQTLSDAWLVVRRLIPDSWGMVTQAATNTLPAITIGLPGAAPSAGLIMITASAIVLIPRNSNVATARFAGSVWESALTATLLALGVLSLGQVSQFLYFNF
jgi:alginate O-acetyltransferase complex protein AlgI